MKSRDSDSSPSIGISGCHGAYSRWLLAGLTTLLDPGALTDDILEHFDISFDIPRADSKVRQSLF